MTQDQFDAYVAQKVKERNDLKDKVGLADKEAKMKEAAGKIGQDGAMQKYDEKKQMVMSKEEEAMKKKDELMNKKKEMQPHLDKAKKSGFMAKFCGCLSGKKKEEAKKNPPADKGLMGQAQDQIKESAPAGVASAAASVAVD